MKSNVLVLVEFVLGRELTNEERKTFTALRKLGYASPIDIAREITK